MRVGVVVVAMVVVAVLAGCGRLGFDPRGGAAGDDAHQPGDGAQQPGDGAGSGDLLVQASGVVEMAGPTTVSLPSPTLAGTLLVASIGVNSLSGFSPPAGWQINANGSVSGACVAAIATETSGTAGRQTFMFTASAGAPVAVLISEWRGIPLGNAIDGGGFGGGMNPTSALAITTALADTTAGDLAVAAFCQDTTGPTFTAGTGWTELGQAATTASAPSLLAEYQTNQPAQKVTATATSSLTAKYAAAIVTFHTQ